MTNLCTIDGCDGPVRGRGWCGKHWQRWRNHGDPEFIKTGRGLPAEARFWRFVTKTDCCWFWDGNGVTSRGYGLFNCDGRQRLAHRYAYEIAVGPIPEGLEIGHSCDVKNCVNPTHLQPMTHAENMRQASERDAWRHAFPHPTRRRARSNRHDSPSSASSRKCSGGRTCVPRSTKLI